MNDSGRKVNIRPAENEFSELMRLLLAWTDNEVNHSEQDVVGIDRKIILPKQADRSEPTVQPFPVYAVKDVFSKLKNHIGTAACVCKLSTASVTVGRSRRALQNHCTGLLIGSQRQKGSRGFLIHVSEQRSGTVRDGL